MTTPTVTHAPFPPTAPAYGRDYRIAIPGTERMPWNQSVVVSRAELVQLHREIAGALGEPEPGHLF